MQVHFIPGPALLTVCPNLIYMGMKMCIEVALTVAGNLLFATRSKGRESINSFRRGIDYSPKHIFTLVKSSL